MLFLPLFSAFAFVTRSTFYSNDQILQVSQGFNFFSSLFMIIKPKTFLGSSSIATFGSSGER